MREESGNNSIVVKPSRLKAFGWAMMCCGIGIPVTFHVFSHRGEAGPAHLAIPLVLFWAATIFQFRMLLLPGGSSLKLTPEGFTFATALGRRAYRWTGVRGFQARRRRVLLFWSKEVVAFSFSSDDAPYMHPDDPAWRRFEHEIPNIFQVTPAALADLLNEYMRQVMDTTGKRTDDFQSGRLKTPSRDTNGKTPKALQPMSPARFSALVGVGAAVAVMAVISLIEGDGKFFWHWHIPVIGFFAGCFGAIRGWAIAKDKRRWSE